MPYTRHRGDALTALATIPDNSVDALITDPPYNSGGRTSSDRTGRSSRAKYIPPKPSTTSPTSPARTEISGPTASGSGPCSPSPTVRPSSPVPRRSSTTAGSCRPRPLRCRPPAGPGAASRPGTSRSRVRRRAASSSPARTSSGEPRARATPTGTPFACPGLYSASQLRKDRVHITQKPVDVMQELVKICPPGGTVLGPLTGSGTTGVDALREGWKFVGIELSDHHRI